MYPHATPFSSIENGSFYRWIIAFFTQTDNPKWKQNWALLSSFSLSPNGQSAGTELKYQTRFKPPSHFIQSSPQFQLEERSYRKSKPNERNTWAGSDRNHFRAVRRNSIRLLWIFHIILFSFPIRLCTTAVRLTTHPFDGLAAPSGKVDRQKNEQTFGRMDGQTDRLMDEEYAWFRLFTKSAQVRCVLVYPNPGKGSGTSYLCTSSSAAGGKPRKTASTWKLSAVPAIIFHSSS